VAFVMMPPAVPGVWLAAPRNFGRHDLLAWLRLLLKRERVREAREPLHLSTVALHHVRRGPDRWHLVTAVVVRERIRRQHYGAFHAAERKVLDVDCRHVTVDPRCERRDA
jgi:hypothetical protein